jgi:hypothetical protein
MAPLDPLTLLTYAVGFVYEKLAMIDPAELLNVKLLLFAKFSVWNVDEPPDALKPGLDWLVENEPTMPCPVVDRNEKLLLLTNWIDPDVYVVPPTATLLMPV